MIKRYNIITSEPNFHNIDSRNHCQRKFEYVCIFDENPNILFPKIILKTMIKNAALVNLEKLNKYG